MMIQKLEIEAFGGLEDYELNLLPGLCYLYGENEAGKSTICAFLSVMLYGPSGKGASDERKRYMPWSGRAMAGTLYFAEGEHSYILKRKFGKTAKGDRCTLYDAESWQELALPAEGIGEHFLGVGAEAFRKTLFVSQLGVAFGRSNEDELLSRLSNLEQSGDEDVFLLAALSELESAAHKLVSKTGRGGALTQLSQEIEALEAELEAVKERHHAFRELLLEIKTLSVDIEKNKQIISDLYQKKEAAKAFEQFTIQQKKKREKEELQKKLDDIKKERPNLLKTQKEAEERAKLLEPAAQLGMPALLQLAQKEAEIKKLEEEVAFCDDLRQEIERLMAEEDDLLAKGGAEINKPMLVAGGVLTAIGLILGITLSMLFLLLVPISLFFVGKVLLGQKGNRERKQREQAMSLQIKEKQAILDEKERENPEGQKRALEEEVQSVLRQAGAASVSDLSKKIEEAVTLSAQVDSLKKDLTRQDEEFAEMEKRLLAMADIPDAGPVIDPGIGFDEAAEKLESMQKKQLDLERQLAQKQAQYENAVGEKRTVAIIQEELTQAQETYEEMRFSYDAVVLARELLASCHETLKSEFTPKLNQWTSEYVSRLSKGRYAQTKVSEDYSMRLKEAQDGGFVDSALVSGGTSDLIYFALRLSVLKTLFGKIPLLILDDTFTQLDRERKAAAFSLLMDENDAQMLYFSCHEVPPDWKAEQIIHLKSYEERNEERIR